MPFRSMHLHNMHRVQAPSFNKGLPPLLEIGENRLFVILSLSGGGWYTLDCTAFPLPPDLVITRDSVSLACSI